MITADAFEVNFDGLVGPTHNYSGLAVGNVASMSHVGLVSNPKEGALQGLLKMKSLMDAGYVQGVLPPQQRPDVGALRDLGFSGSNSEVLARAAKEAPQLLRAVCSASSMWTANAGTITPSVDAPDSRVHFTPANLQSSFHRYLEPQTTGRVLQAIFRDEQCFAHHPVLPATPAFSDEGAANHTRLCGEYGEPGVHLFVYGRQAFGDVRSGEQEPKRYPARQTLEASQAVARQHGLTEAQTVFAQQHPDAIDAGVFHNDVIAVGNGPVLLYHENGLSGRRGHARCVACQNAHAADSRARAGRGGEHGRRGRIVSLQLPTAFQPGRHHDAGGTRRMSGAGNGLADDPGSDPGGQ